MVQDDVAPPLARGWTRPGSNLLPTGDTAPPLARGWTPLDRQPDRQPGGSPARAGMDPGRVIGRGDAAGLPRSRGDGPATGSSLDRARAAPPLARGWTPTVERLDSRVAGSPARAGMDPGSTRIAAGADAGSPARAGMDPLSKTAGVLIKQAPPLARGWTLRRALVGNRERGSPARAGMDPPGSRCHPRWGRLPRSRGDGPWLPLAWIAASAAPPLARGWTRQRLGPADRWHGSPARAGMDRRRKADRSR